MHKAQASAKFPNLTWDIFCRVIDNFGDIGVAWRLCVNLAQRGQKVRLWVDDASALSWMACTGKPGVSVWHWHADQLKQQAPGDVLIETFGCQIDEAFIAAYAKKIAASQETCLWFNLEYLSAERYTLRCHALASPLPNTTLVKYFFYPGFVPESGGLLREADLLQRQNSFERTRWLGARGISTKPGQRLISLFCYEPTGLGSLLRQLAQDAQPSQILVTPGRAGASLDAALARQAPGWNDQQRLTFFHLPALSQLDYDHLLWACDINFVRGEDSLVRALWAGQPFIWQIYPQQDGAHQAKLQAFLDWLQAPAEWCQAHWYWNDLAASQAPTLLPITPAQLASAQHSIRQARAQLLAQDDLCTSLLRFVQRKKSLK